MCIEDLVPIAFGHYVKTLALSMHRGETSTVDVGSHSDHPLEKMFTLFMEPANLWPELCSLPEIISAEISDISLYG